MFVFLPVAAAGLGFCMLAFVATGQPLLLLGSPLVCSGLSLLTAATLATRRHLGCRPCREA